MVEMSPNAMTVMSQGTAKTEQGWTALSVVVKGGSHGYNVYLVQDLGSLSWANLHPPLNPNEEPAGISHWFVCGTLTPPTTPPVTTGVAGGAGGGVTPDPTVGGGSTSSAAALPHTGANVLGAAALSALLLFLGTTLIYLSRPRRARTH